jgi:hypothetical protein
LDLKPVQGFDGLFALTIKLKDVIGYWEPPTEDGDVLINVTWRGLTSNRVRLGLGQVGGAIKDDEGAIPTPLYGTPLNKPSNDQTNDLVGYKYSGDRIRFLEQATFGPTIDLDNRIRRIGLRTWLAEQFEAPYPSVAFPYPNVPLKPINPPADCDGDQTVTPDVPVTCARDTYTMYLPQTWFYKEALYGDSQLRHRVSWALAQLWVISGVDTQQSSWMIAFRKLAQLDAGYNAQSGNGQLPRYDSFNQDQSERKLSARGFAAFQCRTVYAQSGRHPPT